MPSRDNSYDLSDYESNYNTWSKSMKEKINPSDKNCHFLATGTSETEININNYEDNECNKSQNQLV